MNGLSRINFSFSASDFHLFLASYTRERQLWQDVKWYTIEPIDFSQPDIAKMFHVWQETINFQQSDFMKWFDIYTQATANFALSHQIWFTAPNGSQLLVVDKSMRRLSASYTTDALLYIYFTLGRTAISFRVPPVDSRFEEVERAMFDLVEFRRAIDVLETVQAATKEEFLDKIEQLRLERRVNFRAQKTQFWTLLITEATKREQAAVMTTLEYLLRDILLQFSMPLADQLYTNQQLYHQFADSIKGETKRINQKVFYHSLVQWNARLVHRQWQETVAQHPHLHLPRDVIEEIDIIILDIIPKVLLAPLDKLAPGHLEKPLTLNRISALVDAYGLGVLGCSLMTLRERNAFRYMADILSTPNESMIRRFFRKFYRYIAG